MAKLNAKAKTTTFTHNGAPAIKLSAEKELKRAVSSCLLWEKQFYEEGTTIANRIKDLVPQVKPEVVAELAIEARTKMNLRHVPLLLAREMARYTDHKKLVQNLLPKIINRADELAEFVSIYWQESREPLSGQVKKGLAKAFTKFNAFELAKYNRPNAVKLKDVLFLSHAKPLNEEQADTWKMLIAGTLPTPDTWETQLSAGANKKDTWERLMSEKKLGGLALLRNLRNMRESNVDQNIIRKAIGSMNTEKILPYRFIAAAKHAPELEPDLDVAMFNSLKNIEKFSGRTALLIDVSGSMNDALSDKSDLTRLDAACSLAMLLREMGDVSIATFSEKFVVVPARRGFALRDAIVASQPHSSTYLGQALTQIPKGFDRLIVITDEQSNDAVGNSPAKLGYMINVASAKNSVGYGEWTRIDGFSEQVTKYIVELEGSK